MTKRQDWATCHFEGFSNAEWHLAVFFQIMHEVLQPRSSNPCLDTGCSHLCLLSPQSKGSCRCPVGLLLADDGVNCVPLKESAFLFLGLPTVIMQVLSYPVTCLCLGLSLFQTLSNLNSLEFKRIPLGIFFKCNLNLNSHCVGSYDDQNKVAMKWRPLLLKFLKKCLVPQNTMRLGIWQCV